MVPSNQQAGGQCVMRGSCGTKGWIPKPLPCPYDGLPVKVPSIPPTISHPRLLIFFCHRSQRTKKLAHCSCPYAELSTLTRPSAVPWINSRRCATISTKRRTSSRPVQLAETTFVPSFAHSPVPQTSRRSSMSHLHKHRPPANPPSSPSTFMSRNSSGLGSLIVAKVFKSARQMGMPWTSSVEVPKTTLRSSSSWATKNPSEAHFRSITRHLRHQNSRHTTLYPEIAQTTTWRVGAPALTARMSAKPYHTYLRLVQRQRATSGS